jgi:hypothetical protein
MFRVKGYHYYYVCLRQRLAYAFIIMLAYVESKHAYLVLTHKSHAYPSNT